MGLRGRRLKKMRRKVKKCVGDEVQARWFHMGKCLGERRLPRAEVPGNDGDGSRGQSLLRR